MIGHKQVPSRSGGVEVAVEALAVRMAAMGHDVTLYNRGGTKKHAAYTGTDKPEAKDREAGGKQGADGTCRGVHIRRVPVIACRGLSAFTGSLFATLHALFCRYDCIHYHAEGPAAMVFAAHLFGIRTVVTIHGLDWQRRKWGRFAAWYLRLGERIAATYADRIIVLSRAAQRYFWDTYQRETVYIPNGTEAPRLLPPDQIYRRWGLEKDSYILYLGRIVPEKGIHTLIEAFRSLGTEKKLVIAGGASDSEAYDRQLREASAGDDRILFTGFVSGDVLEELYTNCYLYCLPSELEGMPISLLEAMRHGCACLCSDIAACTETLNGCGFCFRAGDRDDLHRVLGRLCEDADAVNGSRARTAAYPFIRHDWDAVTEQTLALYRDAVRKPRPNVHRKKNENKSDT